jgi:salicylate hydroxylase
VTGRSIAIAGAGIGGLAAAIACACAGDRITVLEREALLGEIGAGIQCGPNMTRLLQAWGLGRAIGEIAGRPEAIVAMDGHSGRQLGHLALDDMQQRYGAPYLTLHRADLHAALLAAARQVAEIKLDFPVARANVEAQQVLLGDVGGTSLPFDAAIGADGLWSGVRSAVWQDAPPLATGDWAWRSMIAMRDLPLRLRANQVTVWLGPRMHVVSYPVRAGELLNVAAFTESGAQAVSDPQDWSKGGTLPDLLAALGPVCTSLRETLEYLHGLQRWLVHARPPLAGPHAMIDWSSKRIALLGDAAHPMRPYMAQGAGMAIEDACVLGQCLNAEADLAVALTQYAQRRWWRNARVQRKAQKNGVIFHAGGLLRASRDLALRFKPGVMDTPWLYGFDASNS